MKAVSEQDIRASFVNCSKGEAKRLPIPRDLAEQPWDDLDFLGWRDLAEPGRSYIVTEHDGELIGITLRFPSQQRGFLHRSMCSLCLTTHPGSGVSLMTARKTGPAGREGNSVGVYICTDLACSLYVRGRKVPASGGRFKESLTLEEQVARTRTNLAAFLRTLHVA
ncbi:FBP domain-containing protein [Streptomyces sp. NBC_01762]|uniref:FBP domain-containing protein n=1 Tax=unclassified Streptomyces TaxID=2593676 RepID=UPI002DDB6B22|nr:MULTISPECIES: FBP domain-containing protein [unclassified Streptomyces]WSC48694.1 FBP domain-containing protein [Streptomyces sp. NBC_01762]WSD28346.1 FBP domain-containing protein [Streptomyces sp. NBC_01751]